ncbi:hypothetical protein QI219_03405 [Staphylococcus saprophyticus]|nr:hypothetical protein [Staphylococcus saprophyticus]MDW4257112.1 hypothetical protein [Staphylococcus saprophyticus]
MKIKTKKQLNLPQLIEWLLKSGHRDYITSSDMGNTVTLSRGGAIQFSIGTFFPEETFTVEVEETVTEKTEFELLIEITDGYPNCLWEEASVEDWKDEDSKEFHAYIDGEFKLIWRDGKLVE